MPERKDYDTTVARMAGNIAAGMLGGSNFALAGEVYRKEKFDLIKKISLQMALDMVEDLKAIKLKEQP